MPTPSHTEELDDDEPRTEIRFEQHPACGETGEPNPDQGCHSFGGEQHIADSHSTGQGKQPIPVDREHRAEAHHEKDQMKKQRDYLKPMRRIDQCRKEDQPNDCHTDNAEQPPLGRGDYSDEPHRTSEHLQHKQLPPENSRRDAHPRLYFLRTRWLKPGPRSDLWPGALVISTPFFVFFRPPFRTGHRAQAHHGLAGCLAGRAHASSRSSGDCRCPR